MTYVKWTHDQHNCRQLAGKICLKCQEWSGMKGLDYFQPQDNTYWFGNKVGRSCIWMKQNGEEVTWREMRCWVWWRLMLKLALLLLLNINRKHWSRRKGGEYFLYKMTRTMVATWMWQFFQGWEPSNFNIFKYIMQVISNNNHLFIKK